MSGDIKSRLEGSDAVESLQNERRVYEALKEYNWNPVHGAFYRDTDSGKRREIDVSGLQLWKMERGENEIVARLRVVSEVKTMKGYHLVFSPSRRLRSNRLYYCLGQTDKEKIFEYMEEKGIPGRDLVDFVDRFNKVAFVEGDLILSPLLVDPPKANFNGSAFRETNVGSHRDLQGSVIWNATRELQDVVNSLKDGARRRFANSAAYSKRRARRKNENLVEMMLGELRRMSRYASIFNPFVVTDAKIWSMEGGDLEERMWCRFSQSNTKGAEIFWVDVVNSEYLNEYVENITSNYYSKFSVKGACMKDISHVL